MNACNRGADGYPDEQRRDKKKVEEQTREAEVVKYDRWKRCKRSTMPEM